MRIIACASPGELRVAVCESDLLIDYAISRPGAPDGVGDLHRGRVVRRVPAMAGAFVALEGRALEGRALEGRALEGGAHGFLPDSEGGASTSEGTVLGVRVTRSAQGGKGPRLTARISETERALVGSGPPALLRRGPDAAQRMAALHPEASVHREAFDAELEAQIEALAEPVAELPGGARLSVYPTPALIALDVDLAGASADRQGKRAAQAAANAALLGEVARQIRLRNLGGAIMLDLGGMHARRRAALSPLLSAALAADPLRPRLLGFTALGLAEIVRPRIHPPLWELMTGPHAAALAALRRAAREVAAIPARRIGLRAAPAVVTALRADPVALSAFAERAGRALPLHEDRALAPLGWLLEEGRDG